MLHIPADAAMQGARMSDIDRVLERLRKALIPAKARVDAIEGLIRSFEAARAKVSPEDLAVLLRSVVSRIDEAFPPSIDDESVSALAPEPQRIQGDLTPREIADAARDTLLSFGRPLKRGQLVKKMEERKIPLAGTDKSKNLGTILWRHRQMFVSLPKLGYWPRDVPLAGAYDPETFVEGADQAESSE